MNNKRFNSIKNIYKKANENYDILKNLDASALEKYRDIEYILDKMLEEYTDAGYYDEYNQMDDLIERLSEDGIDIIGRGGNRVVIDIGGGLAAKATISSRGASQNIREFNAYNDASDIEKEFLMPIYSIDCLNHLILTELGNPSEGLETIGIRDTREKLKNFIERNKIIDSTYEQNYGVHNNRIKLFDYGY